MYYGSGLADGWLNNGGSITSGSIGWFHIVSGAVGSGKITVWESDGYREKPFKITSLSDNRYEDVPIVDPYGSPHRRCCKCGIEHSWNTQVVIFHNGMMSGPQSSYCVECAGYNADGFKSRKVADEKPLWKTFR